MFTLIVFVCSALLISVQLASASLTAYAAVYLCILSLGVFIYLVDGVGRALRPSGALKLVARMGRDVIKNVYPRLLSGSPGTMPEPLKILESVPRATILYLREGVILAFDIEGLVSIAQRADCVIEMVPQVGDFVAAQQPLFRPLIRSSTCFAILAADIWMMNRDWMIRV